MTPQIKLTLEELERKSATPKETDEKIITALERIYYKLDEISTELKELNKRIK
jgi:hypothetical protein